MTAFGAWRGAVTAFLAALCACRAPGIHASESQTFEVSVHLQVARSITSRLIKADFKDETAAIWRPYGVQLEWIDVPDSEAAANGLSLEAIVERRIEGPELPDQATVLGQVFLQLDAPTRHPIRVSFDATESLLVLRTSRRASTAPIVPNREMARALGRVLAHEIGHVLLGPPYHDETGLMRAVFRSDDLADPDRAPFRLTCAGVGRLRGRLRSMIGDPRFAPGRNWTGTEHLEGSDGIERERFDRAPCIPDHRVR